MNPNQLTEQLGLFLDVLESGSFSAASRRHPLTPSAVARRIDSLESAVGSQLFIRSTHAVRATPAGLAFAERARRIVAELQLARAEAVSLSSAPEGLIRVDAPAAFGRRHLAPVIADFLVLYPGLDVQVHLIDSFVDMDGSNLGKVDLVLRAGQMADTRLVATPLASMVRIACASPDYLKRRGVPSEPAQLSEHDGLDWDGLAPPFAWRFEQNGQMQLHRPARVRMSANNAEALVCGALADSGSRIYPPGWPANTCYVASCCRCSVKTACQNRRAPASMRCGWNSRPAPAAACCWNTSRPVSAPCRRGIWRCNVNWAGTDRSATRHNCLAH